MSDGGPAMIAWLSRLINRWRRERNRRAAIKRMRRNLRARYGR